MPLYYARLGPVHGLCLAHFCVWLCSVWWLVLIGDCCHLSVCLCPMVENMAKLSDVPAGLSALETILLSSKICELGSADVKKFPPPAENVN